MINRCYEKSMSTKDIKDDFGFITFTRVFKYFGYMITYDLDDYSDISLRIKKSYPIYGCFEIVLGFRT